MTTPQYPGGVAARPKSVDLSFMLWLAAAACGIISSLLNFATADAIYDKSVEDLGIPQEQLEGMPDMGGAVSAGVGIGVFIGLILMAAVIACVFMMRNGHNWARIVLAVLGGLSILGGLIGLLGIGLLFSVGLLGIVQGLLALVQLGLLIAAVIFMFKSDANPYFAAPR